MRLPKSFNELTVEQYQEIHNILNAELDKLDKYIAVLSYLSGKSVDEIEGETPAKIKELFTSISFLDNPQVNESWAKRIRIGTRFYMPVIHNDEFKTAPLVALKHFEKEGKVVENLHEMLACVYVQMGWNFKPKPYDGKRHKQISEDMKKAKMGDVYGFLLFKKKVFVKSSPITNSYLTQASEKIREILAEIEREFSSQDLSNIGDGSI